MALPRRGTPAQGQPPGRRTTTRTAAVALAAGLVTGITVTVTAVTASLSTDSECDPGQRPLNIVVVARTGGGGHRDRPGTRH